MKIAMINVGFGDCFIIRNEGQTLLVDCGTLSFKGNSRLFNKFDDLVDSLELYLQIRECSAVITHFHEDHYSGFKILAKNNSDIFEKIYIPNLFICDNGRPVILEMAIYLYTVLDSDMVTHILAKNILEHIEMVTRLARSNGVRTISFGDKIYLGSKVFDVLWPQVNFGEWEDSFEEILEKLDESIGENDDFREAKNGILANMKEWYEISAKETLESEYVEKIIRLQKKYIEKLDEIKKTYSFDEKYDKSIKYYFTRVFSKTNNAASIVFQNIESKVLMMGDIEKKIIENNLKQYFTDGLYNIIKVPHHGTHSHYSSSIPKSRKFFISTGKRSRHGKISSEYRTHRCYRGKRICSCGKTQCDIINNGDCCINGMCNNELVIENIR